ncbi:MULTISPECIES: hypothetical protein [unclassified Bordetella]|uniref:hypothetical protein n=1 Tax=unclassified Bordetella TaxID=2630031 RepID=UPI001924EC57|nr:MULTISPECIES: hypothetical protein [unclassified Bordetella]
MNLRRMQNRYCTLAFAALSACAGLGAVSAVSAAQTKTPADIQAQYERDVQRCNNGQTHQSRDVCLQEAGAARDEARRQRLDDGQAGNYGNNAMDRCNKLPQAQREDCMIQMQQPSQVSGSVEGGGVLRETVIQVPPGTPGATTTPGTVPGAATPAAPMTPPVAPVAPAVTPGTPVSPVTPAPSSTMPAPAAPVPVR